MCEHCMNRIPVRLTKYWDRVSLDSCIIVHSKTQQIFNLNLTALRIWRLCDGLNTVDGIIKLIVEEFEVDETEARKDVCELLATLRQNGLIRWREEY